MPHITNRQPSLWFMNDIYMSQWEISGFDVRWILDDQPLLKKRRLPPPSTLAGQVQVDSEIYKGNGLLGHEANPMST